jgi:hypothetical protein
MKLDTIRRDATLALKEIEEAHTAHLDGHRYRSELARRGELRFEGAPGRSDVLREHAAARATE